MRVQANLPQEKITTLMTRAMQRRPLTPMVWILMTGFLALGTQRLFAQPAATPMPVNKADLHVDDDNAGKQDGSVRHPFKTVQQAIDAAPAQGVIAVAGGTYAQNIAVREKAVRLYGGYAGGTAADYAAGKGGNFETRDPAAYVSHLQGNGKDSVVTLHEAAASVVDGFRVTGGGSSPLGMPHARGGGFFIWGGTPTIANNTIEKNQTCPPVKQEQENFGGGIFATDASISILNNVIRNNVSGRGAGIAVDGPKATIRGNIVENNIGVGDHGGGIYLFSPLGELMHNRVSGNEIGRDLGYGWGGGIYVHSHPGKYKLAHNTYTGNFAATLGSALFVDNGASATAEHELIYANASNPKGDRFVTPVYVDGDGEKFGSTLQLNHVTIADHTCEPAAPGHAITVEDKSKLLIKNSILWNNSGDDITIVDKTCKVTVTYTLGQKMQKGTGNLSQDPLFANPANQHYRLRSTFGRWDAAANGKKGDWVSDQEQSPGIDAADPAAPFQLEPATNGGRANLGYDGNTEHASKSAP
jgi:hypothetical protein